MQHVSNRASTNSQRSDDTTSDPRAVMMNPVAMLVSRSDSPNILDPTTQQRLSGVFPTGLLNSSRRLPSRDSSIDGSSSPREESVRRRNHSGGDTTPGSPRILVRDDGTPMLGSHSSSASPSAVGGSHSPDSILVQRPPRKPSDMTHLAVESFQENLTKLIESQPISPYVLSSVSGGGSVEHQLEANGRSSFPEENVPSHSTSASKTIPLPPVPRAADHGVFGSPTVYASPHPHHLQSRPRNSPRTSADVASPLGVATTSALPYAASAPDSSVSQLSLFQQRPSTDPMRLFSPDAAAPSGALRDRQATAVPSETPLLNDLAELQRASRTDRCWIEAPQEVAREDAMDDAAIASPMHSTEGHLQLTADAREFDGEASYTWMEYVLSKPVPPPPRFQVRRYMVAILTVMMCVPFCACVILFGLHFWALQTQISDADTTYDPMVGSMKMPNFALMMGILLSFVVMIVVPAAAAYVCIWQLNVLPFIRTMELAEVVTLSYCDRRVLSDEDMWTLKHTVINTRPITYIQYQALMVMTAIVWANKPLLVLFVYTDTLRLEAMIARAREQLATPRYEAVLIDQAPTPLSNLRAGDQEFVPARSAGGSTSLTGDTAFSPSVPRSDTPGHVHSPSQTAALVTSSERGSEQQQQQPPLSLTESAGGTYYANDTIQLTATLRREESPAPNIVAESATSRRLLQRHTSEVMSPSRRAIMSAARGMVGDEDDWRQVVNMLYSPSAMRSPSTAFRCSASPSGFYDRDVQPDESITLGASRFFESTTNNLLLQPADSQQQVTFLLCRLFLPPVGGTPDETIRKELAAELESVSSQFYRALMSVSLQTNGVVCDYQLDSALLTFNAFTPVTQVQLLPTATEAAALLADELQELFHTRPHIKWGLVLHGAGAIVNQGADGTATYIAAPEITLAYTAVKLCQRLQVPAISFTYQEPNEYFHWTCVDALGDRDDLSTHVYAMTPTRWLADPSASLVEESATSQRFIWLFQGNPEKVLAETCDCKSHQLQRAVEIARSMELSAARGLLDDRERLYRRLFEAWTIPEEEAGPGSVTEALRTITQTALRSPRTARPSRRSRTPSTTMAPLPRPPTARPRSVSLLSNSGPRMITRSIQYAGDRGTPSESRDNCSLTNLIQQRSRSATFLGTSAENQSDSLPLLVTPADDVSQDVRLFSPPNVFATAENPALPILERHGSLPTPSRERNGVSLHPSHSTSSDDDSDADWVPVTNNSANVTKAHVDTPLEQQDDAFASETLGLLTVPPLNLGSLAEVLPLDSFGSSTSVNAASSVRFGGNRRTSATSYLRRPSNTVFEATMRKQSEFRPVIVFPNRDGPDKEYGALTPMPSMQSATASGSASSAVATTPSVTSTPSTAQLRSDHSIVVGDKIGEGTGGRVVYKGMFMRTNRMVAIKQVPLPESSQVTEDTQLEIDILSKLRHNNIVGYIGSCTQEPFLYIVMEFVAGGPMQKLLDSFGYLPIPVLRRYMRHLLEALNFIHTNNVIHRDISANNVLVTTDGICKLTDFGGAMDKIVPMDTGTNSPRTPSMNSHDSKNVLRALAANDSTRYEDLEDKLNPSSSSSDTGCDATIFRTSAVRVRDSDNHERHIFGTPLYMSPQACVGELHDKNDIWSLGILFCQCASGHYPWDESQLGDRQEFITKVADGSLRPELPLYAMNSDMQDFAEKCLEPDLNVRWSARQLLTHSFIIGRGSSSVKNTRPPSFS